MVSEAQIVASLVVDTAEGPWRAYATKGEQGIWRLYIENRSVSVLACEYHKGQDVAKLARQYAKDKFGAYVQPRVDTFDRLVGRDAASVVPTCYQNRDRKPEEKACRTCPYESRCESGLPDEFDQVGGADEPDELLMARLKRKLEVYTERGHDDD